MQFGRLPKIVFFQTKARVPAIFQTRFLLTVVPSLSFVAGYILLVNCKIMISSANSLAAFIIKPIISKSELSLLFTFSNLFMQTEELF